MLCAAVLVLFLDLAVVTRHEGGTRPTGAASIVPDDRPWAATMSGVATAAGLLPAAAPAPAPTAPPTTVAPTTVPPPPVAPAPAPASPRAGAWTLGPYQGTGVWLDVYDWTLELTGGNPKVGLADVERMADLGIQTIFIQTSHRKSASHVMEPDRLDGIIQTAHARGMAVVGWYLPMLEDPALDLHRLWAAAQLPIDGLGVDIESLAIGDPTERTRRLVELSRALRAAVGPAVISAITPSAVHLQVVNPGFWPGFPWAELSSTYDVIVPMAYWSVRRPEWKVGERYIAENIDRIRAVTRPDMPIHVAGGIADGATLDDIAGMVRAIQTRRAMGGSLYDWNTSWFGQWDLLRLLRVVG